MLSTSMWSLNTKWCTNICKYVFFFFCIHFSSMQLFRICFASRGKKMLSNTLSSEFFLENTYFRKIPFFFNNNYNALHSPHWVCTRLNASGYIASFGAWRLLLSLLLEVECLFSPFWIYLGRFSLPPTALHFKIMEVVVMRSPAPRVVVGGWAVCKMTSVGHECSCVYFVFNAYTTAILRISLEEGPSAASHSHNQALHFTRCLQAVEQAYDSKILYSSHVMLRDSEMWQNLTWLWFQDLEIFKRD